MSRACTLKINHGKKGFFRTIGHYIHDGKRVQKKFWLGHDRTLAQRKVEALEAAWQSLPGERGEKVWTEESIDAALAELTARTAHVSPVSLLAAKPPAAVQVFPPERVPPPPPSRTFTLLEALDEFTAYFGERNDISDTHRSGTKSRIESIKQHLAELFVEREDGTKVELKNLPVAAVDMEWLAKIRNRITSRPLSKHDRQTPRPISIDCVNNWLMTLGMAFDWLDRTPRIGWNAPHVRWRENFTLTKKQEYALRTPEERDNQGKPKPAYTVDELVGMYKNTSPMGKKYLLMGLMLGWAQEAIRSFRKSHLVMIDGEYFIDRRRGKTGIEGFWWVCPELAQILKSSIEKTPANEDNLAFLTMEGLPLVHGNTDTIRLAWERCLNTAPTGTRELPFGAVKKCGAQIVENLGGHELAQLFLSHRRATVAAGHYTGADVRVGIGKTPYQRLHEVQKQMYEALCPLLFGKQVQAADPIARASSDAA